MAQAFFGRLLFRQQAHYLSRVLGDGPALQGRLQSLKDHSDFERAMELHAAEAAVILHDYAVGWYGKSLAAGWRGRSRRVTEFVDYALTKLKSELEVRGMAAANAH